MNHRTLAFGSARGTICYRNLPSWSFDETTTLKLTKTTDSQSGQSIIGSPRLSALMDHAAKAGIKPAEKTHRGNPIKRAKWHLGIRSQSKPQDIMNEVYRAMKALDFVSTCLIFGPAYDLVFLPVQWAKSLVYMALGVEWRTGLCTKVGKCQTLA